MEVLGYDGPVVTDPNKPDGTPRKLLDSGKLAALGWKPKVGLREGIAKSYAAFLSGDARGT
jgi:GDP-L-fucose synthase